MDRNQRAPNRSAGWKVRFPIHEPIGATQCSRLGYSLGCFQEWMLPVVPRWQGQQRRNVPFQVKWEPGYRPLQSRTAVGDGVGSEHAGPVRKLTLLVEIGKAERRVNFSHARMHSQSRTGRRSLPFQFREHPCRLVSVGGDKIPFSRWTSAAISPLKPRARPVGTAPVATIPGKSYQTFDHIAAADGIEDCRQ